MGQYYAQMKARLPLIILKKNFLKSDDKQKSTDFFKKSPKILRYEKIIFFENAENRLIRKGFFTDHEKKTFFVI